MLTKLQKRILSAAGKIDVSGDYPFIRSTDLEKSFPDVPHNLLILACEDLSANGYIQNFSVDMAGEFLFQSSYPGASWREQQRLKIEHFILTSIFTPIAVSVITTLLLFWFQHSAN